MTNEKKPKKSIRTLAEELKKIHQRRRTFTPEEVKELNDLLEGPTEKSKDDDKKSARQPETEA